MYNRKSRRSLSLFLFLIPLLLLTADCSVFRGLSLKPKIHANFEGERNQNSYAIIKMRGYRFWLKDKEGDLEEGSSRKARFDELHLNPGNYLIGFVQVSQRDGGAAYCSLKPGRVYSFEITNRSYLPKAGVYASKGRCFFDQEREENKASDVEPQL